MVYNISTQKESLKGTFNDLMKSSPIEVENGESYLFYYSFDQMFSKETWNYYMSFLPERFHHEILRFRRWQDRQNSLLGKLMVYLGIRMFDNGYFNFDSYHRDNFGKPHIKNSDLNFNISHSGNMVVCIFSNEEIGVDIEEVQGIEYSIFENVFSDLEMCAIKESGINKFYEYWTRKESIIKAIGKGMSIPLLDIKINEGNYNTYFNEIWYTKSNQLTNIHCSVASKSESNMVKPIELKF